MQMNRTWLAAAAILALSVYGCDSLQSGPKLSDVGMFNEEVTLSVPLGRSTNISYGGAFTFNTETPICEIAKLTSSGDLHVVPNANGPNFWDFAGKGVSAEELKIDLGKRHILDTTDRRSWKEQGTRMISETVTYDIPGTATAGLFHRTFGQFKVRLTFSNDPRIGHWQLSSAEPVTQGAETSPGTGEQGAILETALGDRNSCETENQSLTNLIAVALKSSFGQIENQLKQAGIIERGQDPFVLVSTKSSKAYYIRPRQVTGLTIGQIMEYCSNVRTSTYKSWRLMSMNDLTPILVGGRLPDRPDGALWGQYNNASPGSVHASLSPAYPTSDARSGDTPVSLYDLPDQIPGIYLLYAYMVNDGTISTNPCCNLEPRYALRNVLSGGPAVGYTKDDVMSIPVNFGNTDVRVICVATI
jgi:hypothetical protein